MQHDAWMADWMVVAFFYRGTDESGDGEATGDVDEAEVEGQYWLVCEQRISRPADGREGRRVA